MSLLRKFLLFVGTVSHFGALNTDAVLTLLSEQETEVAAQEKSFTVQPEYHASKLSQISASWMYI